MLLVEIGKYMGLCVYRRSYLIRSPVNSSAVHMILNLTIIPIV